MKPHTYSFRAKNFTTKEVINATVDAVGKTQAQNIAMMDTRFKGWEIILSSFRRTDTAKGANRAGGLDSNGKQLDSRHFKNGNLLDGKSPSQWIQDQDAINKIEAKTHKEQLNAEFFNEFLVHLNLAIENLYNCNMENNAAVLSMDIKSLYNEFRNDNPFK
jgi:hypothetical protein